MCLTDAMISKSECVTEESDCRYVTTRALKQTYTLHQQIFCSYFIFKKKKTQLFILLRSSQIQVQKQNKNRKKETKYVTGLHTSVSPSLL